MRGKGTKLGEGERKVMFSHHRTPIQREGEGTNRGKGTNRRRGTKLGEGERD